MPQFSFTILLSVLTLSSYQDGSKYYFGVVSHASPSTFNPEGLACTCTVICNPNYTQSAYGDVRVERGLRHCMSTSISISDYTIDQGTFVVKNLS